MLRATAGTWTNYVTTLFAQVLFAYHFGSTPDASAYAISFALATSLGGILASVVQTVAVPRLITAAGAMRRSALHFLATMTSAALAVSLLTVAAVSPLAKALATTTGVSESTFVPLLTVSAAVLAARFLATEVALMALSLGHRFVPSVAPALPTSAMVVAFTVAPQISVVGVLLVFLGASVAEAALLSVLVMASRLRIADEPTDSVGIAALGLLSAGVLLSTLPSIERVVASVNHHAADAARYDYALRSLAAVQTLAVGGMAIAGLASWSRQATLFRHDALARSVASTSLVGAYVLACSAAVFLVVGRDLVASVYQHGAFTAADTSVVTSIMTLALVGFFAQGLASVAVSALSAARRTGDLIAIGLTQFGTRAALAILIGLFRGVEGVALAYSISSTLTLGVTMTLLSKAGLWKLPLQILWRVSASAAFVVAFSMFVALHTPGWSAPIRVLIMLVSLVVATLSLPLAMIRRTWRSQSDATNP